YQNLFPPKASISSNTNVITCANPTVLLVNTSSTGIPPLSIFSSNQPVIGLQWSGPSPQIPTSSSSTYMAMVGGSYTLTAKDLNNGCTSNTTTFISDITIYPIISMPYQYTIGCPGGTISIVPSVTTSLGGGTTYSWTVPSGAVVTNTNSLSLVTNAAGTYTLIVTNSLGCSTKRTFDVWGCVGLNEASALLETLPLYPNPAEDKLNLEIKKLGTNTSARIVNTLGTEVLTIPVTSEKSSININNLASGIYFVYLIENKTPVAAGKFIKQ
ncbi:MAG: T9SS type A sorting domain-containing protein, partial [Bacteroidia bacterium]|nr:T9SS type A sorting domain-containing protein [Bacteroidia bacterium]